MPEPAVGSAAPAVRDSVKRRHEVVLLAARDGSAPRLSQSLDRSWLLIIKQALVYLACLCEEKVRFFAGSDGADPGRGGQEQPSYCGRLVDLPACVEIKILRRVRGLISTQLPAVVKAIYACIDVSRDDDGMVRAGDQDMRMG